MDKQKNVFKCLDAPLIQEVLRRTERNPELTITDIQSKPGCESGDNYMSEVIRAKVHWKMKNKDYSKKMIIKRQINNKERREKFCCDAAFSTEIFAYAYILPALQICCDNSLEYPKCLFANSEVNPNIIILEDLGDQGYCMVDRTQGLGEVQTKLVLKELAKLHANSFVLKTKNAEEFIKIKQNIKELVFSDVGKEAFYPILETSVLRAIDSLKRSTQNEHLSEAILLLENLRGKLFEKLSEIVKPKEPFSVICHGDIWINNLLFKQTDDEVFVKLLDLQGLRYCSPCIDIVHFLFTSTTRIVRLQINHYLQYYHEQLLLNISKYLNNKELFNKFVVELNFDWIESEFKSCLLYGLSIALWVMPAITFDKNNIPNLDNPANGGMESYNTEKYHQKIKEIVEEFVDNGWMSYL